MLDTLFERAQHIPLWILSLGNEVVTIEELESKMTKLGRQTKAIAIKYQHLPAVSTEEKKRENREFLVVGWDEALLHGRIGRQIDLSGPVTGVEMNVDLRGAEGATAQTFPGDLREKSETGLAEERITDRRSAIPKLQPRVNYPDARFGEAGLHRDAEGIVLSPEWHGSTLPRVEPEVKNGPVKRQ